MLRLKKYVKYLVLLSVAVLFVLAITDIHGEYENEILLLCFNTLFSGVIPVAVAILAFKTFSVNRILPALYMGGGMLLLGLGSILTGILRFLPDSSNLIVTVYNLCVFFGSVPNLLASLLDTNRPVAGTRQRIKAMLLLAAAGVAALVLAVTLLALFNVIPPFMDGQGATQVRNNLLGITVAFFFASSALFYRQYRSKPASPHLYWYAAGMLMITIGLFAVSTIKVVGSPVNWAGRAFQYVGCVFALLSMGEVVRKAKRRHVNTNDIMEEFFTEAEANYRNLVENLSNAFVITDNDFNIIFCNTSARKLFKYGDDEPLDGLTMETIIPEPHWKRLRARAGALAEGGAGETGHPDEGEARDRSGRAFPAEISQSFGKLSTGTVFTFIINDISGRREQETRLVAQADELNRKNRLITDFFTNISHEFRTPLTIIMNAVDMTEMRLKGTDYPNRDAMKKNMSVMRQNAHRLFRLIANLLDVTKIDAGFEAINLHDTDITGFIRKLVENVEDFAARRGIRVTLDMEMDSFHTMTDGEKLDRILLNLLSNSIKHTARGGRIHVAVRHPCGHILISVSDSGEGIPEHRKDVVFDRFRQVNTSMTRSSEGCGIGLSLSKSLVELLQGKIWFESVPGEGTTFYVELPAVEPVAEGRKMPVTEGMKLSRKIEMEFSDII